MPTASDVFVDTSGWAYYLDRQDPLHPMIVAFVKQAGEDRKYSLSRIPIPVAVRVELPVLQREGRADAALACVSETVVGNPP